jgi:hypothetical protein
MGANLALLFLNDRPMKKEKQKKKIKYKKIKCKEIENDISKNKI